MSETPLLSLPILEASQAQKHVTHNEALLILDAAIQMSVVTRNATAPPSIPVEGARYLLGTSPSGAWAGHGGKLAVWQAGGWIFSVPREGWRLWAEDDDKLFVFNGSAWNDIQAIDVLSNMSRLGVNTIADASNRLSVSSAGVLFSHAGSDQRLKINKQAAGDTGSLLFQTNFSGRAEMGLAGDDNFHVKVTADGTTWNEALVVDRVTGAVTLPNTPGDGTYAARSTLVSAVAGGLSRPNGTITYAAGLTYRWQTGAASLPGLPGLVAEGQISLRHYGAIGNGTSDDTAAVNAARGQTARISGEKLTYGVTGKISALANTWWEDLTLKQLAPAASQSVITLEASGISSLRLVRLKIDRNGNGANDGNNVAPNGPLATCLGLRIDGGQHHYFEDVEVYGRDSGSAIGLFNLDRTTKLIRPYVHDIISVVPSATDDTIQGIWMQACDGIHVVRPRIERIGWKNALGNADPVAGVAGAWKRNRAFSLSGCSQIHIDTIDMRDVDQGLDFTGDIGTGNSDCSVTNGYCYNSGSGAFSVKNLSRRIKLSHCVAELAANWGFSNQAAFDTAVDDFDANQFIGCIALDCGAGAGTNGGFVLLAGSRAYKTPAKLSACRAIDRRGVPLMSYGFYNEALNSAASRTELIDCFAGGYTAAAARGFIDPAGHDPGNSIVNANFELGGTGWNMSPSGINAFTIENDSANAASGTWVARQHNTAGENGNMRSIKTLPVVPGDIVHAGMFFKTSASPAISLLRTRILWFDKTGANIGLSSATNVTAETLAYALNAVTATAPANACAAQLEVLVTKTVGTVWIDRTFMQLKRDAANLLLDSSLTSVQMGGDITASGKSMLTAASVAAQTALLNTFTSTLKGLAPASGGGTANFLRADGTWAAAGGALPPWTAYVAALGDGSGVTEFEATVTDAGVTGASVIELRIAATGAADENEPEFTWATAMIARPASGSFALSLSFAERHSGPLNLQYRIN